MTRRLDRSTSLKRGFPNVNGRNYGEGRQRSTTVFRKNQTILVELAWPALGDWPSNGVEPPISRQEPFSPTHAVAAKNSRPPKSITLMGRWQRGATWGMLPEPAGWTNSAAGEFRTWPVAAGMIAVL